MTELIVACVLKTGGDYEPGHVRALRAAVQRFMSRPYRFVCLTDARSVVGDTLPLVCRWPGWWSKMELFDGRLGGEVLYMDLDTVPVGPLDGLVGGHTFTVLENFWARDRIGSGLMAWSADLTSMYSRFVANAAHVMATHTTTERWGDQGFIRFNSPVPMERWQHVRPGMVVSFKKHVLPANRVPPSARVVCFHGQPRPWHITPTQQGWLDRAGEVYAPVRLAGA